MIDQCSAGNNKNSWRLTTPSGLRPMADSERCEAPRKAPCPLISYAYILYNTYCILHTAYCILYTIFDILYTIFDIVYSIYYILYTCAEGLAAVHLLVVPVCATCHMICTEVRLLDVSVCAVLTHEAHSLSSMQQAANHAQHALQHAAYTLRGHLYEQRRVYIHTYAYIHTHIYIYKYIYVYNSSI